MEDAFVARGSLPGGAIFQDNRQQDWASTALFAVFDGHGGSEVAKFCADHFPKAIMKGHSAQAPTALKDSFFNVDKMLVQIGDKMPITDPAHPDCVGCTAVACLVRADSIIVANAGDSRAVLSRSGQAHDLSHDHKPGDEPEAARIRKAGGFVSEHQCGPYTMHRVNGKLAVSRAMGDLQFKQNEGLEASEQMVSCAPDINICRRQIDDDFLVVACDGVWDVLSSQEVVDIVKKDLAAIRSGDLKPADVVCKVLDRCLSPDLSQTCGKGGDNMTMILVVFAKPLKQSPSREMETQIQRSPEGKVRISPSPPEVTAGRCIPDIGRLSPHPSPRPSPREVMGGPCLPDIGRMSPRLIPREAAGDLDPSPQGSPRPSPRELLRNPGLPENERRRAPRTSPYGSPQPSPREVLSDKVQGKLLPAPRDSPRPSPREVMQNPRAHDDDLKRRSSSPSPQENPGIPGVPEHIPRRSNQHQSLFTDGRAPPLDFTQMHPRLLGNLASPAKMANDKKTSSPNRDGQLQGRHKSPGIPDNKADFMPLRNDSASSRTDKRGWLQRNLTNIGLKKIARGFND
jgi:serine/threonine protein phosphatase PrpC